MMRTAYFLLDARVRDLRSDLIRDWRHLPTTDAIEYRVDELLAAVAFVAEERGMQECVSQRARETTLRLATLTAENDALRDECDSLVKRLTDEKIFGASQRDALRETVARLTVADTDALTALILATDEVARLKVEKSALSPAP